MPTDTTYSSLRANPATVLDQVVDQQEIVIVRTVEQLRREILGGAGAQRIGDFPSRTVRRSSVLY